MHRYQSPADDPNRLAHSRFVTLPCYLLLGSGENSASSRIEFGLFDYRIFLFGERKGDLEPYVRGQGFRESLQVDPVRSQRDVPFGSACLHCEMTGPWLFSSKPSLRQPWARTTRIGF